MEDKKLSWFERIILRRKPKQIIEVNTGSTSEKIIKSLSATSLSLTENIDNIVSDERVLNDIYNQMDQDAVISSALDLFADNATIINQRTGHVASVEVQSDSDIQDELNDFLWRIFKVDTEAWEIIRSVVKNGKVVIDTMPTGSGNEWAFVELDDPAEAHALVGPTGNIKYMAITPEIKTEASDIYYKVRQTETSNYVLYPSSRYITGFNSREIKGSMTVKLESDLIEGGSREEELKVRSGRSILHPVINTWQTLTNMENALYVNRLTKSTQFKVVQVDVTNLNNEQATQLVNDVKNVFKNTETLDVHSNIYQNRRAPITVDDMVFIPKKGEQGTVSIEAVGGDLSKMPMEDIEYQRNKLFAGLGVLKAYLGFEETTPGGLGDSTLTKLDERFGRRVQRLQTVLKSIIEQAIEFYWTNSSKSRNKDNLPEFKIILGKISTKEDKDNREALTSNINNANSIINILKNDWFADKVDKDKVFTYIFEQVLNIDTTAFDTALIADEVELVVRDVEGTIDSLADEKAIEELMNEYELYIEDDKYNLIPFTEAFGSKRIFKQVLTEETYKSLRIQSISEDPARLSKSKKIVIRYTGLDNNNYLTFTATAEDPEKNKKEGKPTSYITRVALKDLAKALKGNNHLKDRDIVNAAIQGDIAVGCSCPASMYWGQQYVGTQKGYSIDPNDIAPTRNLPTQVVCKHVLSTIAVLPFWWNTIVRDLRNKGLLTREENEEVAE